MVKLGRNHPLVQLTTNSVCCRPIPMIIRNNVVYQFKATAFIRGNSDPSSIIGTTNYTQPFFLLITVPDSSNNIVNLFTSNNGYLVPSSTAVNGNWSAYIVPIINTINPILTGTPSILYIDYYSSINGLPGIKLNTIQDSLTIPLEYRSLSTKDLFIPPHVLPPESRARE